MNREHMGLAMSHRRKEKNAKKAEPPKTQPKRVQEKIPVFNMGKYEPANPENIGELIDDLIEFNVINFNCKECGSKNPVVGQGPLYNTTLSCDECDWDVEIITPLLDETKKHVIGYKLVELTNNPEEPYKVHHIGDVSDD